MTLINFFIIKQSLKYFFFNCSISFIFACIKSGGSTPDKMARRVFVSACLGERDYLLICWTAAP